MGRLFSIAALLGIFTYTSGFSATKSTTTRQQHFPQNQNALAPTSHTQTQTTSCQKYNDHNLITTKMTKDDSLSEGEKTEKAPTDSTSEVAEAIGANGDATAISMKDTDTTAKGDKSKGFSLILLPTLLFKFLIVMLVKFATDIVVFPLLYAYRMCRKGKRKVMRGLKNLLGQKDDGGISDVKVNGDSSSSA